MAMLLNMSFKVDVSYLVMYSLFLQETKDVREV